MNQYIKALEEAIKTGPRPHTPYSLKTTKSWDEEFKNACLEQIELYKIGKGRLNQ